MAIFWKLNGELPQLLSLRKGKSKSTSRLRWSWYCQLATPIVIFPWRLTEALPLSRGGWEAHRYIRDGDGESYTHINTELHLKMHKGTRPQLVLFHRRRDSGYKTIQSAIYFLLYLTNFTLQLQEARDVITSLEFHQISFHREICFLHPP